MLWNLLGLIRLDPLGWLWCVVATLSVCLWLRGQDIWPFTSVGFVIECSLLFPTLLLMLLRLRAVVHEQREKQLHWRDDISDVVLFFGILLLLLVGLVFAAFLLR